MFYINTAVSYKEHGRPWIWTSAGGHGPVLHAYWGPTVHPLVIFFTCSVPVSSAHHRVTLKLPDCV